MKTKIRQIFAPMLDVRITEASKKSKLKPDLSFIKLSPDMFSLAYIDDELYKWRSSLACKIRTKRNLTSS